MYNCYIKILCDNIIVVLYICNMGGIKFSSCNDIIREIFMWCIDWKLILLIFYLLGKLNIEVDRVSCEFYNSNIEWLLD